MTSKLYFINLLNLFIEWPGLSRNWRKLFDGISAPPVRLVLSVYSSLTLEKILGMFHISSGHPQATEKSSSGIQIMKSPVPCYINVIYQVLQTVLLRWSWLGFTWEESCLSTLVSSHERPDMSHQKSKCVTPFNFSKNSWPLFILLRDQWWTHGGRLKFGHTALQVLIRDLAPHFRMERFQDTYISQPLECREVLIKQLAAWDPSYLTVFNWFQKAHFLFLGYSFSYIWLFADECHWR